MPKNPRWSEPARIPSEQLGSWQALVHEQHGVVSGAQLRGFGHSKHDITANVDAGRWQRVLPRTYATFTGHLDRSARMHAAILYGGNHATLSHQTAAEEWRMVPTITGPVEITVPYGSNAMSQRDFVIVHRSRALGYTALGTNPPRTRRTDTIVDLAVSRDTAQAALYTVVDLVSSQAVSVPDMLGCVERRPPLRYRAVIAHGIDLVRRGLMSALEVEYQEQVERVHGLPDGIRQAPFVVDGKTLWEDVVYAHGSGSLTVRLDGRATHSVAGVAFRDRRRDNAAELAGRARLVYGWRDVHSDPCGVASEVDAVLQRLGWTGKRKCPGCKGS